MDEHRYIFGTPERELTKTKEVKMRIPISHLIRLHGLKLLSGQNISETVTRALEVYFEQADREKQEQHQARQAVEHSVSDVEPQVSS